MPIGVKRTAVQKRTTKARLTRAKNLGFASIKDAVRAGVMRKPGAKRRKIQVAMLRAGDAERVAKYGLFSKRVRRVRGFGIPRYGPIDYTVNGQPVTVAKLTKYVRSAGTKPKKRRTYKKKVKTQRRKNPEPNIIIAPDLGQYDKGIPVYQG